jgi:pimeloyl-ACP methyl ester carboxylesterase
MKLFIIITSFLHLSLAAEVCYSGYGCFYDYKDLRTRPIALLPVDPSRIATKFVLFTRQNSNSGIHITANSQSSYFRKNKMTRFIVHGFLDTTNKTWVNEMKNALLRVEDSNVILVDWRLGNKLPYTQATANTQVVEAEIAILVNSYVSKNLITSDHVHIIGHSLGAQIAGYAGQRSNPKLGRITGLDPAGPWFINTKNEVRLDSSDAKFVDVIHSDAPGVLHLGLGIGQPAGHVDFYPNGKNYILFKLFSF